MGVALRDIIADYKVPVGWDSLAGTAAIDGNNALYQFLTIIRQPDGTPLMDREGRVTSHISGLFFRTLSLLDHGIQPAYVFDGAPPALKQDTITKRRNAKVVAEQAYADAVRAGDAREAYKQARAATRVDRDILNSARDLLKMMGIPVINAPSEGEAQASWMARQGDVSYVVSQDYDALLFGAPVLLRNLTISGKRKVRGRSITISPEKIVLASTLDGLGLTREHMIEMGILMGTDFNDGIRGVGPKTALKIVRNDMFEKTIKEKLPDFDPQPIIDFFMQPPVTSDYQLTWGQADTSGLHELLVERYDFSGSRIDAALEKLSAGQGQKTLDQWF